MGSSEDIKDKLEELKDKRKPKGSFGHDENGESYSTENFPNPATPKNRELRRRILRSYLSSKGRFFPAPSTKENGGKEDEHKNS